MEAEVNNFIERTELYDYAKHFRNGAFLAKLMGRVKNSILHQQNKTAWNKKKSEMEAAWSSMTPSISLRCRSGSTGLGRSSSERRYDRQMMFVNLNSYDLFPLNALLGLEARSSLCTAAAHSAC